jgi:hypothetical protein
LVDKAQVGFELVVVGGGYGVGGPEKGEVVGKGPEEDAQEEADGCDVLAGLRKRGAEGRAKADLRPIMRKVAKEPDPR